MLDMNFAITRTFGLTRAETVDLFGEITNRAYNSDPVKNRVPVEPFFPWFVICFQAAAVEVLGPLPLVEAKELRNRLGTSAVLFKYPVYTEALLPMLNENPGAFLSFDVVSDRDGNDAEISGMSLDEDGENISALVPETWLWN